ncbi:MAG: phage portal protein [Thermoanaerobaculia bacterium]
MILESIMELRSAFGGRHPSESGAWFGADDESATGLQVTPFSALANTPFYQGVEFISSMIAILPHNAYRRTTIAGNEGVNKDRDSGLATLLRWQPNPEATAFTHKKAQLVNKALWGNSYAEIERDGTGRAVAIWHLPSWLVTPRRVYKRVGGGLTLLLNASTPEDRDRGGTILYEVRGTQGGKSAWLTPEQMFHVPGLGFNGLVGFPVLSFAKEALAIGMAMQKSGAAIFGNAATPSAVLERPADSAPMTPTGERNLIAAWEAHHGGPKKTGRTAVLQEGTSYKPVQMISMRDLQYADSLKNQVPEVARILNISPYFLGHDGSQNTYTNVEGEWIKLQRQTLMPHTTAIEQEDMRKLIHESDAATLYTEHEYKNLLKGDSGARATFYRMLREVGAITPAEIARQENLPPVPKDQGGEDFRPMVKASPFAPPEGAGAPAKKKETPATKEDLSDDEEADQERMQLLRDGLRGMLAAALQRAITRETKTLRQLVRGSKETPEAREAIATFYDREFPVFLSEVAAPALGRSAEGFARAFSSRHRGELEVAGREGADAVSALFDRWAATAADDAASAEIDRLTNR